MRDWEPMDAAVFEMVEDVSMKYVIEKIILVTLLLVQVIRQAFLA